MESKNSPNAPDGDNRPPTHHGTGSGGRGGGRESPGGRWNRRRHNRDNRNDDNNRKSQFTGRESAMNGHVFDYTGERTPEKYIRTMKELVAHVGLTYKDYSTDLKEGLESLSLVDPTPPENPPEGNQVAFEIWKMDIKEYREKIKVFANFRAELYSLVLGQCTDALQERLKSHQDYQTANQDGIALLVIIRSLIHTFEENRKLSDAIMDVKEKFYKFYQGRYMSLERYHELFLAQVEVLDEVGITVEDEALVREVAFENGREVASDDDRTEARNQELAIRFVRGTNGNHKGYLRHLQNSYLDGSDNYLVPYTKPTTFYVDAKRKHRHQLSKGMACCLPRMDNDGTCPMFGATVVSRWGTMRIRLSVQITNQTVTKLMIKTTRITQEPHQEKMV